MTLNKEKLIRILAQEDVSDPSYGESLKKLIPVKDLDAFDEAKAIFTLDYLFEFTPEERKALCSHLYERAKVLGISPPLVWSVLSTKPTFYDDKIDEAKSVGLLPWHYDSPEDEDEKDIVMDEGMEEIPLSDPEPKEDDSGPMMLDRTASASTPIPREGFPDKYKGTFVNTPNGSPGISKILRAIVTAIFLDDIGRPIPGKLEIVDDKIRFMVGSTLVCNLESFAEKENKKAIKAGIETLKTFLHLAEVGHRITDVSLVEFPFIENLKKQEEISGYAETHILSALGEFFSFAELKVDTAATLEKLHGQLPEAAYN